ncbi:MAG: hypothetical protein Q8941_24035, partial [Bacteroidota bacterium]|nr:hypothetical protein [Bacteroidota bacterium]
MKTKLQSLVIPLLLAGIFFTSCKKDSPAKISADKEMVQKVSSWLDAQKVTTQPNKSRNIDLLKDNLELENASYKPSNAGEQILIIPAREDLKTAKGIDQKSAVYLLLILNSQKNISKGNVVIYKPAGGSSSDIPANSFHNIFNGLSPGCSGLFKFLSVTGRSIYQLEYSNKKLSSTGIVKHKPKSGTTVNGTSVVNSIQCYDYYLTLTFWLDDVPVDQV